VLFDGAVRVVSKFGDARAGNMTTSLGVNFG
jgi:hypothetical protein